ncbi:MAG: hypothetical protein HKN23_15030, partial [Verrucomicrobiales bacterium]|nr:hypothetical protein [Verrucomicrobiales bacterium]
GSLILISWHFKIISLTAVVANLVMIPLAGMIITIAVLSSLIFSVKLIWVSALLNKLNAFLAATLIQLALIFSSVPGGYFSPPADLLSSGSADKPAGFSLQILANRGSQAHLFSIPALGSTSETYRSPRHWLLDCGDPFLFRSQVQPLLRTHGINRLEGLFLSHGDQDHLGATPIVLDRLRPRSYFETHLTNRARIYKETKAAIDRRGIQSFQLKRAERLKMTTDTEWEVLFPPAGYPDQPRADDHCLVLRLRHHHWRILFTFDSGFATEKWLLENKTDLRSHVWVKGQNVDGVSGLPGFVDAVKPEIIVATNAGYPAFERIPAEWISGINRRGIELFDLSQTGAVSIRGSESTLLVESFLDPDKKVELEDH